MYDIIIIGSGPAGLSAAVYAGRAQLSAVVVEKDYVGTGQIAASEQVDNYLGLPEINGYELGEKFRSHAEKFGAEFYEGEAVAIVSGDGFYTVNFKDGKTLEGKTILYSAGTSYRRLEVPGGELLGVSYCAVCDGMFYKDKIAAVVGGGDTALGDALYLSKIAKKSLSDSPQRGIPRKQGFAEKGKGHTKYRACIERLADGNHWRKACGSD